MNQILMLIKINKEFIYEINEEVKRRIIYNDDIKYLIKLIINNEKE